MQDPDTKPSLEQRPTAETNQETGIPSNNKLLRLEAGISSDTTDKLSDTTALQKQIPNIQALALQLERNGRSKYTILGMTKNLKALAKRADLNNPEDVKTAIARFIKVNGKPATNNYKLKLCDSYNAYAKFVGLKWERPTYTKEDIAIIPPTDVKCQMLIASARGTLSIKLDISYQTGLRPIEIMGEKGVKVKNIHLDTRTITARITKGCNARPPMKITPELATRLQTYITKHNLQPEDQLFEGPKTDTQTPSSNSRTDSPRNSATHQ